MTSEERIKEFKEVARTYQKYLEQIREIDDKLEELRNKMENVHSIDFEKERSAASFQERPFIEMIERKTHLEKEKQLYTDMIEWIHKVFDSFGSPSIKVLVWLTYVQRVSLSSISEKYLISKDNLYKIRRKHLSKVLSDEMMEELFAIRNSLETMYTAL